MPTIDLTEFVVVENVAVLETGISYPASTGPFSVTSAMIEEVLLSQEDPHIVPPRIKIAHADNPINADLQNLFEELNMERDASKPSFGTILNMRAENAGQTLIGDWYGLPAWLAAILETAYPARSIEGGAWRNEANSKEYSFMLEAVSLLGIVGPGCTSLSDLQEYFSKDGPKVSVIEMSRPKTKMGGSKPMPVIAQVNVEDIRRAFYEDFAKGDRYWWWDRELLADPWEMIVSDPDAGQLYRVPFTVTEDEHGDAVVEWSEPEPIKIQYVPDTGAKAQDGAVAASRLIGPQLERAGAVLAVNTTPKRRKEAKAAMAIDIPALRTRLGISETDLPDDATEEQINAALAAEPVSTTETEEEETEDTTDAETTPPASGTTPGTVTVDAEVWNRTRAGAELAHQQARDTRAESDRALLDRRVREGALAPASRDAYMARLAGPSGNHDAPDRDQLRSFIDGLEAGVLPVSEVGHSEGETITTGEQAGTGLFPELEAARRERASAQGS